MPEIARFYGIVIKTGRIITNVGYSENRKTAAALRRCWMFPRIKKAEPLDGFRIYIEFDEGEPVIYNVGEDIETIPDFRALKTETGLFKSFQIDESRTCIYWSDRIDLPSDTLQEYGIRLSALSRQKQEGLVV